MSVHVREIRGSRVPVTVVEGIDHDAAARHLARDLGVGTAFDGATALVIDLASVRDISEDTLVRLDAAARQWRGQRRWLAVAGLPTATAGLLLDGQRFLSIPAAAAGAQRFFRLVAGPGTRRDRTLAIATASAGIVEVAVVSGVSAASRVGTALPRRALRLLGPLSPGRRLR